MARNTDNIRGGFDGRVYVGPKGSTAPINPKVAWSDDFVEMGWLTDDGIANSRGRDVAEVMAMGVTNAPVWTRITSQESTIAVTLMESKAETLALYYGQSTGDFTSTASASGVPQFATMIEQASTTPTEYALGIDLTDGIYLYRRFYSRVQVTETGDLTYVTTDVVSYPITFKVLVGTDGTVGKHMWSSLALPTDVFPGVAS